jgi:hypothetical protein
VAEHDDGELGTPSQDLRFSNVINKVQSACILPNSQFDHIISIDTSISDILASSVKSVKRPIEKGILRIDNKKKFKLYRPTYVYLGFYIYVGWFTCFKFSLYLVPNEI